jgi:uncharacterized peroxidase-related enzyme
MPGSPIFVPLGVPQDGDDPPSSQREEPSMPHIPLQEDLPGIRGLLAFKPATGVRIAQLIHELLRGSGPLSVIEREQIAVHVSQLNECEFCARSHAAAVRHLDPGTVPGAQSASDATGEMRQGSKLQALLRLAEAVARRGGRITDEQVAAARRAGAGDEEIHDTVLIAAAFCMLNRYVDGLGAVTPHDDAAYDAMGMQMAAHGYLRAAPPA